MRCDTVNKVTPLQLHQVLPTLSTEQFYRTASTSPFQCLQAEAGVTATNSAGNAMFNIKPTVVRPVEIANSCLAAGNSSFSISPSGQEGNRFCKDDYESDDELRRVDIAYSIDGGKITFLLDNRKLKGHMRDF